jgi:hypothetical protein
MDPTTTGVRPASAVVTPLVKKLLVSEGPGAGLVDKPVRISDYVSGDSRPSATSPRPSSATPSFPTG